MPSDFSIGKPFIELQRVESTNNYATGLVHAGMAQHGTAVFAHHQTKGKGQREKQWHGEEGKNIAISIILQPELALSQRFLLSMAVSLASLELFSSYAGDETKIKWPNDIYWRDRKAAGILIENVIQGSAWKWSVVGIGININQTTFEPASSRAVSLKQITGKGHDPVMLAKELCDNIQTAYERLIKLPEGTHAAYRKALFKLGETVQFKSGSRLFSGVVQDVTADGQLVVQTATEEHFNVGEIEWII